MGFVTEQTNFSYNAVFLLCFWLSCLPLQWDPGFRVRPFSTHSREEDANACAASGPWPALLWSSVSESLFSVWFEEESTHCAVERKYMHSILVCMCT